MTLYKNVDIIDLNSIIEKGILSIDELGYNNWEDNKRANNSEDVVYLFESKNQGDVFNQYGCVLIEVEVENAIKIEMDKNDYNNGNYEEYVCAKVLPSQIKNIYIPKILKKHIKTNLEDILQKIIWCEMTANSYGKNGKFVADKIVLEKFAKTAEIESSTAFNFFRGTTEKRMIDLYDINYII